MISDIISTLAIALTWLEWRWRGLNARFAWSSAAA
jgi:hypothetical protein